MDWSRSRVHDRIFEMTFIVKPFDSKMFFKAEHVTSSGEHHWPCPRLRVLSDRSRDIVGGTV